MKKLKKDENGEEDLDEEDEPEGEEDEEEEFAEGEDDLDEADGKLIALNSWKHNFILLIYSVFLTGCSEDDEDDVDGVEEDDDDV